MHSKCPEETNTESMPSCCNCTLVEGQKSHPVSYWGCSHAKGELQRTGQWAQKGSSGKTLFSKFSSPEQPYAAAVRQETQHQQPQAPQTDGKSFWFLVQQHLLAQQPGLSAQIVYPALSSSPYAALGLDFWSNLAAHSGFGLLCPLFWELL
jgi:hypothetical protein